MKSLTIIYVTARPEPKFYWFMESLRSQWEFTKHHVPRIVVVDFYKESRTERYGDIHIEPKPTIFQGKHRLTSEDFWAVSNARNSGLCHANTDFVAFVDDRSILGPEWTRAVFDAMEGNYIVCGSYEKRIGIEDNGERVTNIGTSAAKDNRLVHCLQNNLPNPFDCAGNWTYGCGIALPTEWAVQIGGFEETMDGAGFEDVLFGLMCQNNDYPIKYDRRMHLIEDRTPGQTGNPMRREDRGVSPLDASHRSLEIFGTAKNTSNRHRLFQSRQAIMRDEDFPILLGEQQDWFNAGPINGDYMKS